MPASDRAIPCAYTLPSAVVCTAALLEQATLDFGAGTVTATVGLYLSAAAIDAGAEPVEVRTITWETATIEAALGAPVPISTMLAPFVAAALTA